MLNWFREFGLVPTKAGDRFTHDRHFSQISTDFNKWGGRWPESTPS